MSIDRGPASQREKIERISARLSPRGKEAVAGGGLAIEGHDIETLAESYGTPLYLYSGALLRDRVKLVGEALEGEVEVFFSIKANPSLGICQLLRAMGLGAEVASGGELVLASRAGFSPAGVVFAGPGKSDEELLLAPAQGIAAVNVESVGELLRLSAIGERAGRPVRAALRVNPRQALGGSMMRMGGGSIQFGIPEEDLPHVFDLLRGLPGVECTGLHVYVGTQMFRAEEILLHCRHVIEIAKAVSVGLGRPLSLVDLGGGLGVPYFEGSPEVDMEELGRGLASMIREARCDPGLAGARFVLELGRYLVLNQANGDGKCSPKTAPAPPDAPVHLRPPPFGIASCRI